MRRKVLLPLVVVTALTTACARGKHAALEGWYDGAPGLERALGEQKATGRPVLLYFHTEWCGWCTRLEADVFRTPAFASQFESVLKVRLNPEENRANAEVMQRFPARGFPTVYVIKKGEARGPIVGYMPVDAYVATLRNVLGD